MTVDERKKHTITTEATFKYPVRIESHRHHRFVLSQADCSANDETPSSLMQQACSLQAFPGWIKV